MFLKGISERCPSVYVMYSTRVLQVTMSTRLGCSTDVQKLMTEAVFSMIRHPSSAVGKGPISFLTLLTFNFSHLSNPINHTQTF